MMSVVEFVFLLIVVAAVISLVRKSGLAFVFAGLGVTAFLAISVLFYVMQGRRWEHSRTIRVEEVREMEDRVVAKAHELAHHAADLDHRAAETAATEAEVSADSELETLESDVLAPIQLNLPEWITNTPAKVEGNDCVLVSAGPFTTLEECREKLSEEISKAAKHYVRDTLHYDLPFDAYQQSHTRIGDNQYDEAREFEGMGVMHTRHVLLQFDKRFERAVRKSYRRSAIDQRVRVAGGFFAGIMVVVMGCFVLLKSNVARASKLA